MEFNSEIKSKYNGLDKILKDVSRSFYISIKFLPKEMRLSVMLSYLIARFSDTIADTAGINYDTKIKTLNHLLNLLSSNNEFNFELSHIHKLLNKGELELIKNISFVLDSLSNIKGKNREYINEVITKIIHGQLWEIETFHKNSNKLTFCDTSIELDNYIYSVAGCVGEFWTKIGFENLGDKFSKQENKEVMLNQACKFGKGLQLVNILRDLKEDILNNKIFLPKEDFFKLGWKEESNIHPYIKYVYLKWKGHCYNYLDSADVYCKKINNKRAKFCTNLPKLLAYKTLQKMELEGFEKVITNKIKISKLDLWNQLLRSIILN